MPVVGPRFLVEAGFIITVAVVAGIERLDTLWIIAVVAAAWLIVAAVEIGMWAGAKRAPVAGARGNREVPPQTTPVPPVAEPERPRPAPAAPPPKPPPVLVPVPKPAPRSEPPPPPPPVRAPEPEPARVLAFTPPAGAPREWNLWELERAAREHDSGDVARNEERAYLLMYLRDFAGPDGVLSADFDGLVRDAFGDVLHGVGT